MLAYFVHNKKGEPRIQLRAETDEERAFLQGDRPDKAVYLAPLIVAREGEDDDEESWRLADVTYTRVTESVRKCRECLMFGTAPPGDDGICGNCGAGDTMEYVR
jgi:hypothetical protein